MKPHKTMTASAVTNDSTFFNMSLSVVDEWFSGYIDLFFS